MLDFKKCIILNYGKSKIENRNNLEYKLKNSDVSKNIAYT